MIEEKDKELDKYKFNDPFISGKKNQQLSNNENQMKSELDKNNDQINYLNSQAIIKDRKL